MVHRGIPKTDYMPSRFGSRYVFCIFGWIRKCLLPNLCRLLEWQARFHWLKLSKHINRNAKWPTMVNNSVTHQKAQSLKYGNTFSTYTYSIGYKDENKDKATCRLCFTEVSCKTGNTSNLMMHLKRKLLYHDLSSENESKAPASSAINPKRQPQMKLTDIIGPK